MCGFWRMELDLVLLMGSSLSSSVFGSVCGLGVASVSLSASRQDCVPVLLKV